MGIMIKDQIIDAVAKAAGMKKDEVNLEFPENEAFGDYSTNVALRLGKRAEELAEKIAEEKLPLKAEVKGGFINFWIDKDILIDNLMQIGERKERYGAGKIGEGNTVVIDYSSPNIAKAFGIGHLRSTIIGQALFNLYKFLGYEVIGDNHLGDWGTQFGALLYMIDSGKVTDFDISKLEELYVEFHQKAREDPELEDEARIWFKKLEEGDKKAKEIWQKCVDVSLKEFERIYKILGVGIDFAFGESYYQSEMKAMMENPNVRKHLSAGEDGAKILNLDKFGIKTPLMFLKSDGATTYAARDLAAIVFRVRKWDPDIIIYEVGAEQSLHFKQVFAAARLLGLIGDNVELVHTAHGLYLAPDGKKFATREGKTVKLEQVLNEAIEKARKLGNNGDEVASQVGVGAIKYYDLMHHPSSNIVFDWEKIMNLEGNSGPYLQYTVARINSVLAKAKRKGIKEVGGVKEINPQEMSILRSLIRFQDIIASAAKTYSPNLLCSFLYSLAQKFNTFYNANRVIGSKTEEFRLNLAFGVEQVLKNGLGLLGIKTPERM